MKSISLVLLLVALSACSSASKNGELESLHAIEEKLCPAHTDSSLSAELPELPPENGTVSETGEIPAPDAAPPPPAETAAPEKTPEIRVFPLTLVKQPKIGRRVHTFSYGADDPPPSKKLLLVRDDSNPVAAIRILKADRRQRIVFGVVICRYESSRGLEPMRNYVALEKIRDL